MMLVRMPNHHFRFGALSPALLSALVFVLVVTCTRTSAQDFIWSSVYEMANDVLAEKDYVRAEKLALEAVEESEKLPKEGRQLLKSLQLLHKVYLCQNKTDKADLTATRIRTLGGSLSDSGESQLEKPAADRPKVEPEDKAGGRRGADRADPGAAKIDSRTDAAPDAGAGRSGTSTSSSSGSKPGSGGFEMEKAEPEPDAAKTDKEEPPARAVAAASGLVGEMQVTTRVRQAKEIMKLAGHCAWTKSIEVSPDGKEALSGSADGTVRLWDLTTGKEVGRFDGHEGDVYCVAFSPSGNQALSGGKDQTVRLWDLDSEKEIKKFVGHVNMVTCVAFAPEGTKIASGGYDGVIRIWDTTTGKEVQHMSGNLKTIKCLAFTPDGEQLISGGSDKLLSLWRVKDGHLVRNFSGCRDEITCVAVSMDGTRALSACKDLTIRVWDVGSGEELKCLVGHGNWIQKAQFIAVDKAISGSLDKTFRVWDLDSGKELRSYTTQHFGMWSLGFSDNGDRAITGSDDFTLRVWSLQP